MSGDVESLVVRPSVGGGYVYETLWEKSAFGGGFGTRNSGMATNCGGILSLMDNLA